jgi:hypothetical protein
MRLVALAALALTSTALAGAGGPFKAIAAVGLPTAGSQGQPVMTLNDPYLTRDGRIAFTGAVMAGAFVWVDGGIVWKNADGLPAVLTGAEGTMGVSDSLDWIYSPSTDGDDSVWVDGALFLKETDPAPDFPGQFISFTSRPQMNADGTPTFVAGITATQGSGAQFRALYKGLDKVLAGGDTVSGETLVTAGTSVGFNYDFSTLGINYICRGLISAPAASNDVVIANGAIVARESQPTPDGDNWQNFGDMKTNELGDIAFGGDTDGPVAGDGFLAFNDEIAVREGQTLAGFTLTGSPSAVGLNDLRQLGAIWTATKGEILFVITPGPAGPQAEVLLKTGDPVDLNGDGVADGLISDFNASQGVAPGLDLPRQCRVCANVDVTPFAGGDPVVAIVCAPLPAAPGRADLDGDGDVDAADLAVLLAGWGGPGIADLTCDGIVNAADLTVLLSAWS